MNPGAASNGGGWQRRDARADYERHHTGPNMTPMVDVVMVILIFFMASTVILGPELLLATGLEPADEPRAAGDPRFAIERPAFEIELSVREGLVVVTGLGVIDGELSSLGEAARSLARDLGMGDRASGTAASDGGVRMIIAPADTVPYEAVVRVQDLLRDAGFEEIGLR